MWRLLFGSRNDRDRAEEFEAHLESLVEHYVEQGMPPQEAARRARLQFGNPRARREEMADLRRSAAVTALWRDLGYAVRVLRRSPVFTLAAVTTLSIGIGATTAVFSVVQAVVLRPLPYENPDRLTGILYQSADSKSNPEKVPSPALQAWMEQSRTFDGFAFYATGQLTLLMTDGEQVRVESAHVSPNFFSVLGVRTVERGRGFQPPDVAVGAEPVVMLSHRFWSQRFGASDDILGRALRLAGRPHDVIGVTPRSFQFPGYHTPDVFLLSPQNLLSGNQVALIDVIGRLRPDQPIQAASDELRQIGRNAEPSYPAAMRPIVAAGAVPRVIGLQRRIAGDLHGLLFIALGAVSCILLLACANVTNLLIARLTGRERELTMRAALGATPRRLAQWLLAESFVLTGVGAMLAMILLLMAMGGLRTLLVGAVPHAEAVAIDGSVLAFTAISTLLTSLLCVAIPIARVFRRYGEVRLTVASTGSIRTTVRDSVGRALVTAQVTAALTLLIGALLLLTTLWQLSGVGLGFDASRLLTMKVSGVSGPPQVRANAVADIVNRVQSLPGVVHAGASTVFPLGGHMFGFTVPLEGEPPPAPLTHNTGVDVVSPGYFRTMGVSLITGREFGDGDGNTTPSVAVVNRAFARDHDVAAQELIGRRLTLGGTPQQADIAIVGIVSDFKDGNPGDEPRPTVYRPFSQAWPQLGWRTIALTVRTASDPDRLSETVRREVAALLPHSVVYDVKTMDDRVAATVAPQRQRAVIFTLFAAIAVILAAVGLYGLLASTVAQNMHELGVRLALGATRLNLIGLVCWQAFVPTAIGIVLGFGASVGFSRALADRLYGVSALDPMTYGSAAIAMLAIATLATGLPAYRVTKVNPIQVLKN
jgi:predicted permease